MKKVKEEPTQYPGIYRVLNLNDAGKWVEPLRGKKFKARRYETLTNGKTRRAKRSFNTIAEAKVYRAGCAVEASEPSPIMVVPQSSEMTFEELLETWVKNWLPSVDIATQLRYKKYLKHFGYFLKMKVADIQPDHIDAWIAFVKRPEYLATCHSTRCSYEHEFKVLKAIMNYYCSRRNRNYRLPFLTDHRKMLKVKEKAVVNKDLSLEQFNSFVQELKALCWGTKWEAIYYLGIMQYAIYCRIQEPAALHVEDFDLVNNRLEIKRKVQWLRAKGHKDQIVMGLKSNGGKIFSPIPELAVQVLKEWMLRSGVRTGLLFQIDGEIIAYRQIQFKYDQALRNAKLPFTATHILRHASLTEAYCSTTNILAVKKFAGHSSLKTTEKYAKVRDEQMIETQHKMDEKLKSILK